MRRWAAAALLACAAFVAAAATSVPPAPAKRILSLSPHLTELTYAAGAGSRLVGVVAYSDYPEAAKKVPQIGDAFRLDMERVMALRADLVLAWGSGTPRENVERLRALGMRVEDVASDRLDDIPRAIERIGVLAGTQAVAMPAAQRFRAALAARRAAAPKTGRAPRVFIQIGRDPFYTVNDQHLIGEVVALCGGQNVFGGLAQLAPTVGEEDIVATAPEIILVLDDGRDGGASARAWQKWKQLPAVKNRRVYTLNSNVLARSTPRVLQGIDAVCKALGRR